MEISSLKKQTTYLLRIGTIASWLLLLFSFSFLIFYIWCHGNCMLDSDASSEMILANLLASEGGHILSSNWYYSTELRVLNNQLVFTPLFMLWHDWHLVRTIGSAILYLILLLSYYYLCQQLDIAKAFPLSASLLLLPTSEVYFKIVLAGLYYIPHIAISFIMMGLVLHYSRAQSKYCRIALLCVAFLLSFCAGLGGLRQLLIFYAPALVAACAICFLKIGKMQTSLPQGTECRMMIVCLISSLAAFGGYCVNAVFLHSLFSYMDYSSVAYQAFSLDCISTFINGLLVNYGYQASGSIFSAATILNAICALTLIILFLCIGFLLFGKEKLAFGIKFVLLFFLSGLFILLLLYTFTNMGFSSRYLLPVTIFALPTVAGCCCIAMDRKKKKLPILCIVLVLCLLAGSRARYHHLVFSDKTIEMRKISAFLTENGYNNGYATFWNANILTELSNGQIDVWDWGDGGCMEDLTGAQIDQTYPSLQKTFHSIEPPQASIFLLFSQEEDYSIRESLPETSIIYQDDAYIIFGFPNYHMLKNTLERNT